MKSQMTNHKLQTNYNDQNPNDRNIFVWSLEIGAWSLFGIWKLEFGILNLGLDPIREASYKIREISSTGTKGGW